MSFSRDVQRIADKMNEDVEKVARAIFLELFSSVIKDTPVLTGRLRGNWQTSAATPNTQIIERTDGNAAISEAYSTINKPGLYYLTNNLPYAERIEFDGWSKVKAPAGMVRKNIARLNSIIRNKAK